MSEKNCYTCQSFKSVDCFNKNKIRKDGLNSICKECSQSRSKKYYSENREKHLGVIRKRTLESVKKNQIFIISYLKTHPCVDCEEADILVLDFDHLGNKKHNISCMIAGGYSQKSLLKEISKCQVRCANCHRRKTAKDYGWYKYKLTEDGS